MGRFLDVIDRRIMRWHQGTEVAPGVFVCGRHGTLFPTAPCDEFVAAADRIAARRRL